MKPGDLVRFREDCTPSLCYSEYHPKTHSTTTNLEFMRFDCYYIVIEDMCNDLKPLWKLLGPDGICFVPEHPDSFIVVET